MSNEYVLTTNSTVGSFRGKQNFERFVYVSSTTESDFGGGTLYIEAVSPGGKVVRLKSLTSVSTVDDVAHRFQLSDNYELQVTLEGATSPSLFIGFASGVRYT